MTVTVPYTLTEGQDAKNLKVWYIDNGQKSAEFDCTYENGSVTFETDHFSVYAVMYEESSENSVSSVVILIAAALIVAVLLVVGIFTYKRRSA